MKQIPRFLPRAILLAFVWSSAASGQATPGEVWPELQVQHHFDERTRAIASASESRFRDSNSAYEGRSAWLSTGA